MQFLYSVLGFVLAIGILVTIHEFGHFWVARKAGVKVLKFSVGFGKSIKTWRREGDPTEYTLAMIPLGGYVKMLDGRVDDVPADEQHLAFNNQSLGKRTAIVAAGPIANFIFAILAMWAVYVYGVQDPKAVVGTVLEQSIAEKAGFEEGDLITAVDGKKVHGWSDQLIYLLHKGFQGKTVNFSVVRDGNLEQPMPIAVDFSQISKQDIGAGLLGAKLGLGPAAGEAIIEKTVPGKPADLAGLKSGARILSINGEPINSWRDVVLSIQSKPNELITLSYSQNGTEIQTELTTQAAEYNGETYGQIGIYPQQRVSRMGPWEGFTRAVDYTWRFSWVSLLSIGKMLTKEVGTENLSGPITIASMAGYTVQQGLVDFVKFLAIISISLGLINLFPIPMLDGGHLLYFAIEAIKGSPVSEKTMLLGQQIGIMALLLLMSLAFYNDIIRLIS